MRYFVTLEYVQTYHIEVDAESGGEAQDRLANAMGDEIAALIGSESTTATDPEWAVCGVEEVDDEP